MYVYATCSSHLRPEDVLVDVGAEDGGSREHGRVCRRHDGSGHAADAHDGDEGRGEVLQGDGQDQSRLPALIRRRRTVGGLVPV